MGHLPSYLLIFFILNRVKERAKVGIIPLPLTVAFPHLPHGFIPALHTGISLSRFFLSISFVSHCYNIPHKWPPVKGLSEKVMHSL